MHVEALVEAASCAGELPRARVEGRSGLGSRGQLRRCAPHSLQLLRAKNCAGKPNLAQLICYVRAMEQDMACKLVA